MIIIFREITKNAILKALKNHKLNMNEVNAQKAFNYRFAQTVINLSPCLWANIQTKKEDLQDAFKVLC